LFFALTFHAVISLILSIAYFIYPIFQFSFSLKLIVLSLSILVLIFSYFWIFFPQKIFFYWISFSSLVCISHIWIQFQFLEINFFSFLSLIYVFSFLPLSFWIKNFKSKELFLFQYRKILLSASIVVYTGFFSVLVVFWGDEKRFQSELYIKAIQQDILEVSLKSSQKFFLYKTHFLPLHTELKFTVELVQVSDFGVIRSLWINSWNPKEILLPISLTQKNLCILEVNLCREK